MFELPAQEFNDRVERVRTRMAERGLDGLIIYSDMHYFTGGNAFYLSNWRHPQDLTYDEVLVPGTGALCLIISPNIMGSALKLAKAESWIKDVRGTPGGIWAWGVDYAKDTREALEARNLMKAKIGMVGAEFMTKDLYQSFLNELPDVTLEDATDLMEEVRAIKSPAEIEILREASRLTDLMVEMLLDVDLVRPGRKQMDAIAEVDYRTRLAGADGTEIFFAAGEPFRWGKHMPGRKFEKGDMAAYELGARFRGYHSQVCRTYVLGKASDEQRRVYDAVHEASERMAEIARPGVSGDEIFRAGCDVITRAGYVWNGIRFGHCLGLNLGEPPQFSPGEKRVLKPGHYMITHAHVFLPDTKSIAIIGDNFLITETGHERLTGAKEKFELT